MNAQQMVDTLLARLAPMFPNGTVVVRRGLGLAGRDSVMVRVFSCTRETAPNRILENSPVDTMVFIDDAWEGLDVWQLNADAPNKVRVSCHMAHGAAKLRAKTVTPDNAVEYVTQYFARVAASMVNPNTIDI